MYNSYIKNYAYLPNGTKVEVGDTIEIVNMFDEPSYTGKKGVITSIDSANQLHGTWGGLAVIVDTDEIKLVKKKEETPKGE